MKEHGRREMTSRCRSAGAARANDREGLGIDRRSPRGRRTGGGTCEHPVGRSGRMPVFLVPCEPGECREGRPFANERLTNDQEAGPPSGGNGL